MPASPRGEALFRCARPSACLAPGWPQLSSGLPFGPRSQASLHPPHWAVMGKLKIALFTTRDDSRVGQLRPASREVGSRGMRREWEAKRSSDPDSSELNHSGAVQGRSEVSEGWMGGHSHSKPAEDSLEEELQPLEPEPRACTPRCIPKEVRSAGVTCSADTEPSKHGISGRQLGRGLSDPLELGAPPRHKARRVSIFAFNPCLASPANRRPLPSLRNNRSSARIVPSTCCCCC